MRQNQVKEARGITWQQGQGSKPFYLLPFPYSPLREPCLCGRKFFFCAVINGLPSMILVTWDLVRLLTKSN